MSDYIAEVVSKQLAYKIASRETSLGVKSLRLDCGSRGSSDVKVSAGKLKHAMKPCECMHGKFRKMVQVGQARG